MGARAYILLLASVPALMAAFDTSLKHTQVALLVVDEDGGHHPTTRGRPVARVDVHVPAPEAGGTMIGVSVSLDDVPAVTAGEVLGATLELLDLATLPVRVSIVSSDMAATIAVTAALSIVNTAANVCIVARPVPVAGTRYYRRATAAGFGCHGDGATATGFAIVIDVTAAPASNSGFHGGGGSVHCDRYLSSHGPDDRPGPGRVAVATRHRIGALQQGRRF